MCPGLFVGLAQQCKRFCQKYYVRHDVSRKDFTTRSGRKAKQNPEKKLIYEVFSVILKKNIPEKKLATNLVSSIKEKLTVVVKNNKLESRMHDHDEYSVTRLFNGISHIWSEQVELDDEATGPVVWWGLSWLTLLMLHGLIISIQV